MIPNQIYINRNNEDPSDTTIIFPILKKSFAAFVLQLPNNSVPT